MDEKSLREEIQAVKAFYLDTGAADVILEAGWLNDGIENENDSKAVTQFSIMATSDAIGSILVANFLASADVIDDDVLRVSEDFVEFALSNAPLPEILVRIAWVADGLSIQELWDLSSSVELARKGALRVPAATEIPTPEPIPTRVRPTTEIPAPTDGSSS